MKSCAVLDLDSTLVDMFGTEEEWRYMLGEKRQKVLASTLTIKVAGNFMWGAKRPYCDEFLAACFETFDLVGVWSAGSVEYVDEVVQELFGGDRKPAFIWAKPMCVESVVIGGVDSAPEVLKTRQKPLSKLFKEYPNIDPDRTLIFDDMIEVCQQDSLHHVHVPAFFGKYDSLHSEDNSLLQLSRWMKTHVAKFHDYKRLALKGVVSHHYDVSI